MNPQTCSISAGFALSAYYDQHPWSSYLRMTSQSEPVGNSLTKPARYTSCMHERRRFAFLQLGRLSQSHEKGSVAIRQQ